MQEIKIYYMRDNHTFLQLSQDVDEAVSEIHDEWYAGYTHGMLCSKSPGTPVPVHGNGLAKWDEFEKAARAYFAVVASNAVMSRPEGVGSIES